MSSMIVSVNFLDNTNLHAYMYVVDDYGNEQCRWRAFGTTIANMSGFAYSLYSEFPFDRVDVYTDGESCSEESLSIELCTEFERASNGSLPIPCLHVGPPGLFMLQQNRRMASHIAGLVGYIKGLTGEEDLPGVVISALAEISSTCGITEGGVPWSCDPNGRIKWSKKT